VPLKPDSVRCGPPSFSDEAYAGRRNALPALCPADRATRHRHALLDYQRRRSADLEFPSIRALLLRSTAPTRRRGSCRSTSSHEPSRRRSVPDRAGSEQRITALNLLLHDILPRPKNPARRHRAVRAHARREAVGVLRRRCPARHLRPYQFAST